MVSAGCEPATSGEPTWTWLPEQKVGGGLALLSLKGWRVRLEAGRRRLARGTVEMRPRGAEEPPPLLLPADNAAVAWTSSSVEAIGETSRRRRHPEARARAAGRADPPRTRCSSPLYLAQI